MPAAPNFKTDDLRIATLREFDIFDALRAMAPGRRTPLADPFLDVPDGAEVPHIRVKSRGLLK